MATLFCLDVDDILPPPDRGVFQPRFGRRHPTNGERAKSRETEEGSKLAIGRKLRTTDLEREVKELCEQLGIKPRYDLTFDKNTTPLPKKE